MTPETIIRTTTPKGKPRSGIGFERLIRYGLALTAIGLLVWVVWFFRELVILLVIGVVLAYMLGPIVDGLQQRGVGRTMAVLLTFVLALVVFGFVVVSLIPFFKQQATDAAALIAPENIRRVASSIEQSLQSLFPIEEGAVVLSLQQTATTLFGQARISSMVSGTLSVFTNIAYALIVVPLVTFFLMKDGRQLRNLMLRLVPNRYFEITLNLLEKVETNLGYYFRALVVRTVVVSLLASALLALVGLKNAVVIGVFTGLANTIPYFGPAIGFVAGAIVAVAQTGDLSLVLPILMAMALTQIVDNILQPIVFSRAARTHPLVILCCVLIGAKLGGIVGMLLAIPVLTIVLTTIKQILWSLRNYYIFRAT